MRSVEFSNLRPSDSSLGTVGSSAAAFEPIDSHLFWRGKYVRVIEHRSCPRIGFTTQLNRAKFRPRWNPQIFASEERPPYVRVTRLRKGWLVYEHRSTIGDLLRGHRIHSSGQL